MSHIEQMRNLVELEEKYKFDIEKIKKKIGKDKSKFDPDVLLLKIMLCDIKIAQIDITKAEQASNKHLK